MLRDIHPETLLCYFSKGKDVKLFNGKSGIQPKKGLMIRLELTVSVNDDQQDANIFGLFIYS